MEDLIRQTIYFNKLSDQDYHAILHCLQARHSLYKKGEVISRIGDDARYVYIITQGLAKSQAYDINGKLFITRDYHTNDMFGINYTPDEELVYNEELVAIEDTYVLRCDLFRFITPCQNRCKRHIDLMISAFKIMSSMVNTDLTRINTMCQSKTRFKLIAYLKSQSKGLRRYFRIPYNQSELAIYLGVERSALSLELNKLKHEGIIDFDDKLYIIKKSKI